MKTKSSVAENGKLIQLNEVEVKNHLGEIVRGTVEEVLNTMLEQEAGQLCNAARYERTEHRQDTRAGHYKRKLHTKAGEVELQMPKLRKIPFETAIIERYRRREESVEEALIEMYLAGVSVRRVEDITEALWGTRVSAGTVSELNKKVYGHISEWLHRPIEGVYPYVHLDGIWMRRTWGGEVRSVSILVAVGVDQDGYRTILGAMEGAKEDHESWNNFLKYLKARGLGGVELFISDKCMGVLEAIGESYPQARWQRCVVHFYRNVFRMVPKGKIREVASMLKAVHANEDITSASEKSRQVQEKLISMKLAKAADIFNEGVSETFAYYSFPREHWRQIRTNNMLERILREIRRRTRVVGCFPDGNSALMLAAARLRYVAGTKWGIKKYMDMEKLNLQDLEEKLAG